MNLKAITLNVIWSVINQILSRGGLILAGLVLAPALNSRDFGAFNYFNLTISTISTYAGLGLGTSGAFIFAKPDKILTPEEIGTINAYSAILLILSMLTFCLILTLPSAWLLGNLSMPRLYVAIGVAILILIAALDGLVMGLGLFKESANSSLYSFGILIGGSFYAASQGSLLLALQVYLISQMIRCVYLTKLVVSNFHWSRSSYSFFINFKSLKSVLSSTGPVFFVSLLSSSGGWIVGRNILNSVLTVRAA